MDKKAIIGRVTKEYTLASGYLLTDHFIDRWNDQERWGGGVPDNWDRFEFILKNKAYLQLCEDGSKKRHLLFYRPASPMLNVTEGWYVVIVSTNKELVTILSLDIYEGQSHAVFVTDVVKQRAIERGVNRNTLLPVTKASPVITPVVTFYTSEGKSHSLQMKWQSISGERDIWYITKNMGRAILAPSCIRNISKKVMEFFEKTVTLEDTFITEVHVRVLKEHIDVSESVLRIIEKIGSSREEQK